MKITIFFAITALLFTACSAQTVNTTNIFSIIESSPNFTSVSSLLSLAGPLPNVTEFISAFVPVDGETNSLPPRATEFISSTNSNLARKFVFFGVVPREFNFTVSNSTSSNSSVGRNSTVPTILYTSPTFDNSSGNVYITTRNNKYFLNNFIQFNLSQAIRSDDGLSVIYPTLKAPLPDFTLQDFIALYNDTLLSEAIDYADLEDEVEQASITLFAPSNEAFFELFASLNITLDQASNTSEGQARALLLYHTVDGIYSFLNLTNDKLIRTGLGTNLRINIYNDTIFTVNGHVIPNGGWIKRASSNSSSSNVTNFSTSLTAGSNRVGFFYPLNNVLIPPIYNAYQYIGLASNYSTSLPENVTRLLTREAITVFYFPNNSSGNTTGGSNSTSTAPVIYIVNGTYFLPGLASGSYNLLSNSTSASNSTSTISVVNNGSTVTVGQYRVISSIVVTNGVLYVLGTSSSTSTSVSSSFSIGSAVVTETGTGA